MASWATMSPPIFVLPTCPAGVIHLDANVAAGLIVRHPRAPCRSTSMPPGLASCAEVPPRSSDRDPSNRSALASILGSIGRPSSCAAPRLRSLPIGMTTRGAFREALGSPLRSALLGPRVPARDPTRQRRRVDLGPGTSAVPDLPDLDIARFDTDVGALQSPGIALERRICVGAGTEPKTTARALPCSTRTSAHPPSSRSREIVTAPRALPSPPSKIQDDPCAAGMSFSQRRSGMRRFAHPQLTFPRSTAA